MTQQKKLERENKDRAGEDKKRPVELKGRSFRVRNSTKLAVISSRLLFVWEPVNSFTIGYIFLIHVYILVYLCSCVFI